MGASVRRLGGIYAAAVVLVATLAPAGAAGERPPTVPNTTLPLAPFAFDAAACRTMAAGRPNGAAFMNDDAHVLTGIRPVVGQSVASELFPNTPIFNFLLNHQLIGKMDFSQFGALCFVPALRDGNGSLGFRNLADGNYIQHFVLGTPYVGTAHRTDSRYETVETPDGPHGEMVDHDTTYATSNVDTEQFARPLRVRNAEPIASHRVEVAPLVNLQKFTPTMPVVGGVVEPPRGKHPVEIPEGTPVNVHFYGGFHFGGGIDRADDAANYRVIQVDDDVRVGDAIVIRRGSVGLAHDDVSTYGTLRMGHGRKGDGYTKFAFHLVNVFSTASTLLAFEPETIAFDFQQILDRGQAPETFHIIAPDRQFTGTLEHVVVYLP